MFSRPVSGSPDLNPLENLWAILKKRVEDLEPGTKEELIDIIIIV
jgi:transposase